MLWYYGLDYGLVYALVYITYFSPVNRVFGWPENGSIMPERFLSCVSLQGVIFALSVEIRRLDIGCMSVKFAESNESWVGSV